MPVQQDSWQQCPRVKQFITLVGARLARARKGPQARLFEKVSRLHPVAKRATAQECRAWQGTDPCLQAAVLPPRQSHQGCARACKAASSQKEKGRQPATQKEATALYVPGN